MFLLPTGKIYTVRSYKSDEVYVGSTIQELSMRMGGHRADYKVGKILGRNKLIVEDIKDWYIELYELFPCNYKTELKRREGEVIREIGTLNKQIAGRTGKEYYIDNADKIKEQKKEYRIENSDKIKEYTIKNADKIKEYYIDNADKIKEYQKEYSIENADKIKEYLIKNADKIKEKKKEIYIKNADKIKEYYIKNADKIKEYKIKNVDKIKEYNIKNADKIKETKKKSYLKKKLEKQELVAVKV